MKTTIVIMTFLFAVGYATKAPANANFINIALDGEKGEGKILAQKYGVKAYPTLLFIDHSGQVVAEAKGFHSPRRFVELGERTLKQR